MVPISVLLKQCMLVYLNKPSVSPVWIFSVPFCPGTFINDPCYTKSGSRRPTVEHLPENPNAYRRTNVCFEDKRIRSSQKQVVLKALDNFAYLTRKNIVQITATCNFKAADAFSQSTVRTTLLLLDIVRYVIIVYLNWTKHCSNLRIKLIFASIFIEFKKLYKIRHVTEYENFKSPIKQLSRFFVWYNMIMRRGYAQSQAKCWKATKNT